MDAYVQGFLDKCAEQQVDVDQLLKLAQGWQEAASGGIYRLPSTNTASKITHIARTPVAPTKPLPVQKPVPPDQQMAGAQAAVQQKNEQQAAAQQKVKQQAQAQTNDFSQPGSMAAWMKANPSTNDMVLARSAGLASAPEYAR